MPRILIVDDEENERRRLATGLALEGFEVVSATCAAQALELVGAARIDAAVVDLLIQGLNGLDLARRIRRAYPCVRVLLASAFDISALQVERANCGVVAVVSKPYVLGEVARVLRAETAASCSPAC
jgi:DNA-binding response OmpR family regulator